MPKGLEQRPFTSLGKLWVYFSQPGQDLYRPPYGELYILREPSNTLCVRCSKQGILNSYGR